MRHGNLNVYIGRAGRAFRIKWKESTPGNSLASVLEAPHVNWDFAEADMQDFSTHRENWYFDGVEQGPDARPYTVFGNTDLRRFAPDARTVAFSLNTGAIDKLFYNPYHRQQVSGILTDAHDSCCETDPVPCSTSLTASSCAYFSSLRAFSSVWAGYMIRGTLSEVRSWVEPLS